MAIWRRYVHIWCKECLRRLSPACGIDSLIFFFPEVNTKIKFLQCSLITQSGLFFLNKSVTLFKCWLAELLSKKQP